MPVYIDEEKLAYTIDKINKLIDVTFDTGNIKAIVVANEDGLPIASKIFTGQPEIEFIMSAILSTLVNTSGKMSERLEMGEPYDITIKLDKGNLILRVMASRVCVGIMLPQNVNLPYFEIKIDEFSRKVKDILFENKQ